MKALLLSLAVPTVALVVPRAWTVTSSAPILDRSQRVKTGVSMLVPADVLTDALAGTPLESVTALPFYEPVATGIALSPAVAALAFVAKGGLQLALTPILKASGPTVPFDKYQLGRKIGSGNYGAVYEASSARDTEPSVVIKSTTTRDSRGQQFARAELFMNQKLKLCGQSGCMAQFEGHYTDDDGALNLVFRREGTLTLDKALQGDFPWNVEPTLLGSAADDRSLERRAKVIRTISGQVFANLAGIHSWSIVHRDVKGGNLILAERERRFKFIDFGAACDLFSRTNYDPTLQVFDPKFGPPEAPPAQGGLVPGAGGRFDVFSAALLIIQMCFKAYRSDSGIVGFKKSLALVDYDLAEWRSNAELRKENEEGFAILDAYGGFELLERCLRQEPQRRISAAAAASSRFCRA